MLRKRLLCVLGVVAGSVVVAGVGVSEVLGAAPVTVVKVRPTDFVDPLSDTRDLGNWDMLAEGVRIWNEDWEADSDPSTDGSDAKTAEYFEIMRPLSEIDAWDYEWFGSRPQVTQQFFIDTDGDTSTREGVFVAEKNYPGDHVWLVGGSATNAMKLVAPSCDGDPSILVTPNDVHCLGGSGSYFHGSLSEWADVLPEGTTVTYGGFAIGSGIRNADGVLRSLTYGDTRYEFTSEPEPTPTVTTTQVVVVPGATETVTTGPTATVTATVTAAPDTRDVTGAAVMTREPRSVSIRMRSDDRPDNTVMGDPLVWSVRVDGDEVAHFEQGFGRVNYWARSFAEGTGTHRVVLYKNGDRVREIRINTGT